VKCLAALCCAVLNVYPLCPVLEVPVIAWPSTASLQVPAHAVPGGRSLLVMVHSNAWSARVDSQPQVPGVDKQPLLARETFS
jgi:hypothetical protein